MDVKAGVDPSQASGAAQPQQGRDTQELTLYVQNLLQQMQTRFQDMSNSIVGRIDEMGTRIDTLERNISDLMQQVRIISPPSLCTIPLSLYSHQAGLDDVQAAPEASPAADASGAQAGRSG